MTLPKYALKYKKCTREELRAFLKARSGEHAEIKIDSKGSKSYYISRLRELDRNTTFRFMDLPPEMRNLVYENLLVRDTSLGRSAFTAILRTRQQIFREAHGILLAENTLRLEISLHDYFYDVEGLIHGDLGESALHSLDLDRGGSWSAKAGRLSPVHNFDTCVDFADVSARLNSCEHVRKVMYQFHHRFVQNCPNAKQINIRLTNMDNCRVIWKPQLLEPLKLLSKGCKVRFEGLSEQQEADCWHMVGQDDH